MKNTSEAFQFSSNSSQIQFQFQIQILQPFSLKVPEVSKSKQANKETKFKTSDDHLKHEIDCNVVFLKEHTIIFVFYQIALNGLDMMNIATRRQNHSIFVHIV